MSGALAGDRVFRGEVDHAIATGSLGAVQPLVRLVHEVRRVGRRFGHLGNAEARRDHGRIPQRDAAAQLGGCGGAQPFGDGGGQVRISPRQRNAELLAAVAADDVVLPHATLQDGGKALDDAVACGMPVDVIDGLEPVDVGHEHGEGRSVPPRLLEQRFEQGEERPPVHGARHRVLGRHAPQIRVLPFQLLLGAAQFVHHVHQLAMSFIQRRHIGE